MSSSKKFPVQKRDNFRIDIHSTQNAKIEFDRNKMIKANLADISLGGCRLQLYLHMPQQFLDFYKPASKIVLKIELYDFQSDSINAFIRNIIPGMESYYTIGIEFEKLSAQETASLQSTLLKIDRDRRTS